MKVKLEFEYNSKSSPKHSRYHFQLLIFSVSTMAYASGYMLLFESNPTAVSTWPGKGPFIKAPSSPRISLKPALNPFFNAHKQIYTLLNYLVSLVLLGSLTTSSLLTHNPKPCFVVFLEAKIPSSLNGKFVDFVLNFLFYFYTFDPLEK